MTSSNERWQQWVVAVVAVTIVVSGLMSMMLGGPIWVFSVVAIGVGWRYVPGFWRTMGIGLLGGAIAGAIVLGPGFRLAMRMVAILDPIRSVEFTMEGTVFILIAVGLIMGGVFGLGASLLRRAFRVSGRVMALGMTAAIMGLLLADPGLRSEFVDLGVGPWLNIPMFGAVVFLYSLVANRLIDRFAGRKTLRLPQETAEVQA
jgi:hypothetical protein